MTKVSSVRSGGVGDELAKRLEHGPTGLRLVKGSPTMLSDLCAELEREAEERRIEEMAEALLDEVKRQDGFIMDAKELAKVALAALHKGNTNAQG